MRKFEEDLDMIVRTVCVAFMMLKVLPKNSLDENQKEVLQWTRNIISTELLGKEDE